MQDNKMDHLAKNSIRTESIVAVPTTKSVPPGGPLRPATPVTRRKRWHSASLAVLMPLGAIGVVVYLLRPALAKEYEGVGAALCAVACGGFLVWHFIHLLAEEDEVEEQQFNANQATVPPPEPNSAGQETNPTTPPSEAGQNLK